MLIGVATPGDLIKDSIRTPFNIGHRIDLTDFTIDEVVPLASHLPVSPAIGREVLQSDSPVDRWASVPDAPRGPLAGRGAGVEMDAGRGRPTGPHLFFRARRGQRQQPAVRPRHAHEEGVRPRSGAGHVWRRPQRPAACRIGSSIRSILAEAVGHRAAPRGRAVVRNPIYERVFDERWTRGSPAPERELAPTPDADRTVLLILTVLVTIPLAIYAWRQKTQAELQAREARVQRDTAERQRALAEETLRKRTQDLETAQQAVEKLKPFDPASAAIVGGRSRRHGRTCSRTSRS